jgi:dTDP-4-dehydrorhamnose 3,5-epimerase
VLGRGTPNDAFDEAKMNAHRLSAPATEAAPPSDLPVGVRLRPLTMHRDDRGAFTELFREMWDTGLEPVQWGLMDSGANVMRGVHVHFEHVDYVVVLNGRVLIGLRDLRRGSPTHGLSALLDLRGNELAGLTIPPGVAHGLYWPEPAQVLLGVSHYWDPTDERGCRWDDPALGIPWPSITPQLSERDAACGPLSALLDAVRPHQVDGQ